MYAAGSEIFRRLLQEQKYWQMPFLSTFPSLESQTPEGTSMHTLHLTC